MDLVCVPNVKKRQKHPLWRQLRVNAFVLSAWRCCAERGNSAFLGDGVCAVVRQAGSGNMLPTGTRSKEKKPRLLLELIPTNQGLHRQIWRHGCLIWLLDRVTAKSPIRVRAGRTPLCRLPDATVMMPQSQIGKLRGQTSMPYRLPPSPHEHFVVHKGCSRGRSIGSR